MIAYPGFYGIEDYEPAKEIVEGNYQEVIKVDKADVI